MISADLGSKLEQVVTDLVESGRYNSKSEVLREGVRLVQEREARLAALDAAIAESLAEAESRDGEQGRMKVILTPTALRDLASISDFIARDNPLRADTFLDELHDRCLGLAQFPERFPLIERYRSLDMRRCPHGSYAIFYRIEIDRIVVHKIVHGSADHGTLFDEI